MESEVLASGAGFQLTDQERAEFDALMGRLRKVESELVAALLQYEQYKRLSIDAHESLQKQIQAKGAEVLASRGLSPEQSWRIDFGAGTISKAAG